MMKKEAKEYLKLVDDDRTFASIEEAIKQAQSDIYVSNKLYKKQQKEKTIPITAGFIMYICGWKEFCYITGAEHLLFETFTIPDNVVFDVKISHAKMLNLI